MADDRRDDTPAPKVAIACSGVGHIRRGIEAWAEDLATALQRRGIAVDLFGGAPGIGTPLPCLRRTGAPARFLARLFRRLGGWRYGMGAPYEIEQWTFAFQLWRRVRANHDLVHVQDPLIGRLLDIAHARGWSRPKVILANGTGEQPALLGTFRHLQELTPEAAARWHDGSIPAAIPRPRTVHMVPNFLDIAAFTPGDQRAARAAFDLPADGVIILCCAAIRSFHKRIDVLAEEFAAIPATKNPQVTLVIAGGRENDTDAIIAQARARLGDRVRFLVNVPRDRMADLYRAADIFVLSSLFETFGIVLLEAMATGLPVACHDVPGFRYVVGPAGVFGAFDRPGGIARALAALLDPPTRARHAALARAQVEAHFSEPVVTDQIMHMYQDILSGQPVTADDGHHPNRPA